MTDASVTAADVSIGVMTATARWAHHHVEITTKIPIHNENDDDAANVRCVVVLPPTSHVVSTTPPATVGPTYPPVGSGSGFVQSTTTQGHVIFDLRYPMTNPDDKTVEIVTRVHKDWAEQPIAAFVFSDLPDPNPGNNCGHVAISLASLPPCDD